MYPINKNNNMNNKNKSKSKSTSVDSSREYGGLIDKYDNLIGN